METIIFLLNHTLTYCINVHLGKIVLKCQYRVSIEQLFDRKSLLFSQYMYCENQPELLSDKGSNRSRGATHDIGSGPLTTCYAQIAQRFIYFRTFRINLHLAINLTNTFPWGFICQCILFDNNVSLCMLQFLLAETGL